MISIILIFDHIKRVKIVIFYMVRKVMLCLLILLITKAKTVFMSFFIKASEMILSAVS